MKPIFPAAIDNTMRKELVKCQMAAHYRFELGLQGTGEKKVDLVAGKAFAAGIEAARRAFFANGYLPSVSAQIGSDRVFEVYGNFACPTSSNKTAARMAGALLHYLEAYPLEKETVVPYKFPDGKLAIELSAAFPLGLAHPDTREELEYAVNFDMLGKDIKEGGLWVVDEKTTSQMGDKWMNQWPLDSQMTGYVWAAMRMLERYGIKEEVKGAIINGIAIRKNDTEAARFKTYREPWMIERWFKQLQTDVIAWEAAYKFQVHNQALDHACAYYLNPCVYAPLCLSRNPEKIMEGGQYVVEFWDPKDRK